MKKCTFEHFFVYTYLFTEIFMKAKNNKNLTNSG